MDFWDIFSISIGISIGTAFILFIIWILIPRKGKFKKIADGIEHVIDTLLSSFP